MKNRVNKDKKAQMKLSFGMIFAIILIIVFLAFAVWGISRFLGLSNLLQSENFMDELKTNIEKMYKSSRGLETTSYKVPKDTLAFCFKDSLESQSEDNAYFIPQELGGTRIENLNWPEIKRQPGYQQEREGLCFEPKYNKLRITLEKNYGDDSVTIKRPDSEE